MWPYHVALVSGMGSLATVDDITIYCQDRGSGNPVVLLHGGSMAHQSRKTRLRSWQSISGSSRPTPRRTDATPSPIGRCNFDVFACDVLGLVAEPGIGRASFIGFSDDGFGGLLLG